MSSWTGWSFEMDKPPTAIDVKSLAAEVSAQHGIRIDPDDPIFAVVTLNRLVFDQAVAEVLEHMQASVREFEAATEKVQIRAGAILAQEVREFGMALRGHYEQPRVKSEAPCPKPAGAMSRLGWITLLIAVAAFVFAFGAWAGRSIHCAVAVGGW